MALCLQHLAIDHDGNLRRDHGETQREKHVYTRLLAMIAHPIPDYMGEAILIHLGRHYSTLGTINLEMLDERIEIIATTLLVEPIA